MNKDSDLILGVLSGPQYLFKYPGIESYVESIRRSGYSGQKIMLSWNIHPETKKILIQYGFEVIDINPWPTEPFFHARMRLCWEYLKDNHNKYRYIFFLDIKDLILQSDPSVWMEENVKEHEIIASTECVTIEQEETNQMWARTILGEDKYQEIKDSEVINGGTWAGKAEAMTEVFHRTHLGCSKYTGAYPPCQININYVLHTEPFKNITYIPRWDQGFASCLHPMWSPWRVPCAPFLKDEPPVLDIKTCLLLPGTDKVTNMIKFNPTWGKDRKIEFIHPKAGPLEGVGCVYKDSRKPFSIVHGPDRDWTLKSLFDYKYRFRNEFDLEKFLEEHEELLKQQRTSFKRPLRSPEVRGETKNVGGRFVRK